MINTDDCPGKNKDFHGGLQRPPRIRCATVHGPWGSAPEEKKQKQYTSNKKTTPVFDRIQECTGVWWSRSPFIASGPLIYNTYITQDSKLATCYPLTLYKLYVNCVIKSTWHCKFRSQRYIIKCFLAKFVPNVSNWTTPNVPMNFVSESLWQQLPKCG